jgi:glycosyltransferase involved in cell wall biosynthesis
MNSFDSRMIEKETILHVINKPVPPEYNAGGANRLVHWLAAAQARAGHQVYVAAPAGRETTFYRFIKLSPKFSIQELVRKLPLSVTAIEYHGGGDDDAKDQLDLLPMPVLRSVHWVDTEMKPRKNSVFVSKSHCTAHGGSRYIHNGIQVDDYQFCEDKEDYFLFLAKVKRSKKGVVEAIDIAKKTGIKLAIAGGCRLGSPHTWFKWHPRIYPVGIVDGEYKLKLLARARALIVPIKWDEPFGLTMIEAMASGTPVLAYRRGAVPEIVEHGVTGFVCDTQEQMIEALGRCATIDPARCRERVRNFFSDELMAKRHVDLLKEIRSGKSW